MFKSHRWIPLVAAAAGILTTAMVGGTAPTYAANASCRPDGLYQTPGVNVPYCLAYDGNGRQLLGPGNTRRIIGYFTSWRNGSNGQPAFLVPNIPWSDLTTINFAFAHVDPSNQISVNPNSSTNPDTGMTWPGVPGAQMDPSLPYQGHFNLLTQYKRKYPNVKTMISVGGWAETGGYIDPNGNRVASGGFYSMTTNPDGSVNTAGINTFADSVVTFLRTYGFDGVDIDYEYPTSETFAGNPLDFPITQSKLAYLMASFVSLMTTLRQKLDTASAADNKYYMISAAVPDSAWLLRGEEDFQVLQYIDYVNVMSYDIHGAWNEFVGPNAPLYDDGQDAELLHWSAYGGPYAGIGTLNVDWGYHYYRGNMPADRINLGVPYYTRGWQGVTGGNNGLWGTASGLPNCPPGTNITVPCGAGGIGIDNIWHDPDPTTGTGEEPSGTNPMWHAMNLQNGIEGDDYITTYGLNPTTTPKDRLTGTYAPNYDATLDSPWLWNSQKSVFLSTETTQSLQVKANYIKSKGIGGVMIWELAGDYAWNPTMNGGKGEYFFGTTLTDLLHTSLSGASAPGNLKADQTMPTQLLDISANLIGYPLGDNNYPINPHLHIVNNSGMTLPGGTEFQFDYGTTAPASMSDQSGFGLHVVTVGQNGPNAGTGLQADFNRVSFSIPGYMSLAAGASLDITVNYYLPIAAPSNWTVKVNGTLYGLQQDYPRSAGGPPVSPTPTATPTATPTPTAAPSASGPATGLVATATGGGNATVTWAPPANNGGQPVSWYAVWVYSNNARTGPIDMTPTSSLSVTGLTPNSYYIFTVTCWNGVGWSQWSGWSNWMLAS